ncbi:hypothetical protein AB8Q18_01455 [Neisseriaceae bacterium CLB008]|nr:hypothetical protein [Neisseriaceae bacterium]
MTSLTVRRLSVPTLYKLLLIGLLSALLPISLIIAGFALFGFQVLSFNGQYITGPIALIAAPLWAVMMTALLTLFMGTLMALGLWLYARFRPLHLHYHA